MLPRTCWPWPRRRRSPSDRTLFLRGYLGLAARGDVPIEQRLDMARQAAGIVQNDGEKRLLLSTLSGTGSPQAVPLITPYLDDAAVRQEAALAIVGIAEKIPPGTRPEGRHRPHRAAGESDPDDRKR